MTSFNADEVKIHAIRHEETISVTVKGIDFVGFVEDLDSTEKEELLSAFEPCVIMEWVEKNTDWLCGIDWGESLKDALEYIADPVSKLQRMAEKAGCVLDGAIALSLANDAGHLKDEARKALDAATPKEKR